MHEVEQKGSIQEASTLTVDAIGSMSSEKVDGMSSSESEDDDDDTPNHYVRGALLDHNLDPHIYCDFATDVYSFGMVLWSIITRKLPYKGCKPMEMILMIKNAQRLNVSERAWRRWERCKTLDIDVEKLKDLLEHCWAQYLNTENSRGGRIASGRSEPT